MKKNLFLVNSQYNIILAVQVRRKMFADEPFDIVLSDESKGLREIYEAKTLEGIFDRVYFADNTKISGRKNLLTRALALANPKIALRALLGQEIDTDYTDIFFWNPDAMFYYMQMAQHNRQFKLHLYCDAATNYYMAEPGDASCVIYDLYKPFLYKYLRTHYNVKYTSELEYDDYMFSTKYCVAKNHRTLVEIPQITVDSETKSVYNKIFTVTLKGIEKYKYLMFAQPIQDYMSDFSLYKEVMKGLVSRVGSENVVVKMHPRCTEVDEEIYKECGFDMISDSSPWEIYCLNNDNTGKVFISMSSGAGVMPYILFGQKNRSILLYDLFKSDKVGDIRPFYDALGDYLDIPSDKDDFYQVIDTIEGEK